MGLGFAIVRPIAALITGICGGLLVNRLVPAEFFLHFGNYPLLQMLVILLIAVPMYICSTGSIPVAAALIMKGLSPGAALVMLMAGPAVNLASILVVRKSLGTRFTWVYLLTIVVFSVLFGLLINAIGIGAELSPEVCGDAHASCCEPTATSPSGFRIICSILLVIFIIIALIMKLFSKFKKQEVDEGTTVYCVEGMHCNHCKANMEKAAMGTKGVISAEATPAANTLVVTGTATDDDIRKAVEQAGFEYKGRKE